MILFTLLVLVIIAAVLCILLINLNQKKKSIRKLQISFCYREKKMNMGSILANKEVVLRWNSTGLTIAGVSNVSGKDNMHLNRPADLELDYQGSMFIADINNHRIQKYVRGSMNGTTAAGFGNGTSSTSPNGLIQPVHVIVDDEGNLYITNHGNYQILYWPRNALSGVVVGGFGKEKR